MYCQELKPFFCCLKKAYFQTPTSKNTPFSSISYNLLKVYFFSTLISSLYKIRGKNWVRLNKSKILKNLDADFYFLKIYFSLVQSSWSDLKTFNPGRFTINFASQEMNILFFSGMQEPMANRCYTFWMLYFLQCFH